MTSKVKYVNVKKRIPHTEFETNNCGYGAFADKDLTSFRDQPLTITYGPNWDDWRSRISRGENATTDLDVDKVKIKWKAGYLEVQRNCYYYPWQSSNARSGVFNTVFTPTSFNMSSDGILRADNDAKRKFLKKIQESQTGFQSGIFMGELLETLHMIRNPAKGLRRGVSDYLGTLKKGRRKYRNPKDRKKLLADSWLEHSFGWTPFLSDIDQGAKALAEFSTRKFNRTLKAQGEFEDEDNLPDEVVASTLTGVVSHAKVNRKIEVVYRGKINVRLQDPVLLDLKYFGISFEEFVPTAWEILPWSFLIDYFTNIGDILTGWSYGRGNLAWSNRTEVLRQKHSLYGSRPTLAAGSTLGSIITFHPSTYEARRLWIERRTYDDDFIPEFRMELPTSVNKWLNMGALAIARGSLTPFR